MNKSLIALKTTVARIGENIVRNLAGSVSNHSGYACQQQLQIAEYRRIWSVTPNTTDPLFPFGVTQLAGYSSEGFPYNTGAFRLAQTGGYGYMPNAAIPNSFLGQAFDLGDPWSKSCLHTKKCFGWGTPYSFNAHAGTKFPTSTRESSNCLGRDSAAPRWMCITSYRTAIRCRSCRRAKSPAQCSSSRSTPSG